MTFKSDEGLEIALKKIRDGDFEADGGIAGSNVKLTSLYNSQKAIFRTVVFRAERVSRGSGGVPSTGNRMFWSSVLFTRICVIAKSILKLLPETKPREHWDFSSVASLSRNLSEAYLFYFWLCQDSILDEVRDGRFIMLYLHDYAARKRIFPESFVDSDDVYKDLVNRFNGNAYLNTLAPTKKKDVLKGDKTPFIQDEVLERMGVDAADFRMAYRFFSEHTHTGPISFYRMIDHDRGTGVETRHEKKYMVTAISFATDTLNRAIDGHLQIFPDAETRPPYLTDREIERNVERSQGRQKSSKQSG